MVIIKKNFFTIVFLILTILFLAVLIIDIGYTQAFSAIPWPFFIIFFVLYFIDLAKKAPEDTPYGIIFIKFFSGFLLLGFGFLLTTDVMANILGLTARFYGDVFQIIGVIILYFFFTTLPPLSEFNWHDKIESIYLMGKSGIPIFARSFKEEDKEAFEMVVPGALTTIQMMLNEITRMDEISVIKKANNITIILPSKSLTGVIITKLELNSLKVLLEKFVNKVENIYSHVLSNWNNKMEVFKPIEAIYESIFK